MDVTLLMNLLSQFPYIRSDLYKYPFKPIYCSLELKIWMHYYFLYY
jgi:hypothetical protein